MNHLLPTSSLRGGFLVRMLSGLAFVGGGIDLPELLLLLRWTGGACARSVGFLCVCIEGSTFFRPVVIPSPRLIWLNTAPISVALALDAPPGGGGGGCVR